MLSYRQFQYKLFPAIHRLKNIAMKSGKSEWTQQEITLLHELIPLFNSKKWKNISRIFKQRGFERSETECRQKWVNFFNPKIKNQEWSKRELETLYESYQKHKTQWYLIEKMLPGRTQNKIKNRFYGTIRNFVRFIVRFFNKETKSYSTQINRLSPKYLNMIYESDEGFQFLNGEFPKVIKQLQYLFDRSQFSKKVKEKKETYFLLFEKLIEIFNSNTNEPLESENSEIEQESENQQINKMERNQFQEIQRRVEPDPFQTNPFMFPTYFFFYPNLPQ